MSPRTHLEVRNVALASTFRGKNKPHLIFGDSDRSPIGAGQKVADEPMGRCKHAKVNQAWSFWALGRQETPRTLEFCAATPVESGTLRGDFCCACAPKDNYTLSFWLASDRLSNEEAL